MSKPKPTKEDVDDVLEMAAEGGYTLAETVEYLEGMDPLDVEKYHGKISVWDLIEEVKKSWPSKDGGVIK